MKLHSAITINGKPYPAGSEVAWYTIYPFFLLHMLVFGGSGFFMAYGGEVPAQFLYLHGGIAILVYVVFYLAMFGRDEVRWMFINAGLGLLGIRAEIGWLLGLFEKRVDDFPWFVHVIPFAYYVLYTFLLRQLVLDLARVRDDPVRKTRVEWLYVGLSLALYLLLLATGPRG